MAVIATASFLAFSWANRMWSQSDPEVRLVVLPGWYTWMFFSLFGGLTLCWEVTIWGMNWLLGRGVGDSYAQWSDAKYGFQCTRILRWMALILAVPCLVVQILSIPRHASFGPDCLGIGSFARWSTERHRYSDVSEFFVRDGIRLRDGSFESEPSIILRFRDGGEWSSWTLTESRTLDPGLVEFLAQHIGQEPVHEHPAE
jgi:hypothetical protein